MGSLLRLIYYEQIFAIYKMVVIHRQIGISLIEILLAWLVLIIVMIPTLEYQLKSAQRIEFSYWQTIATIRAQSMLEQLLIAKNSSMQQNENQMWEQYNQILLPKGHGRWSCESNFRCQVQMYWWYHGKHFIDVGSVFKNT